MLKRLVVPQCWWNSVQDTLRTDKGSSIESLTDQQFAQFEKSEVPLGLLKKSHREVSRELFESFITLNKNKPRHQA